MSDRLYNNHDAMVKRINAELIKRKDSEAFDYSWIFFSLEETVYAISTRYIERVAVLYEIIPFNDAPECSLGVTWDRSGMIRLYDMRVIMGHSAFLSILPDKSMYHPIILEIWSSTCTRHGLVVDSIIKFDCCNECLSSISNCNNQSKYVLGATGYSQSKKSAQIIDPKCFSELVCKDAAEQLNWNERIDIEFWKRGCSGD